MTTQIPQVSQQVVKVQNELFDRAKANLYKREVETGVALPSANTPVSLPDAVRLYSKQVRGREADAVYVEAEAASDQIGFMSDVLSGMSDEAINYLYAMTSYKYFARKYLPDAFNISWAPLFHDVLFDIVRKIECSVLTKPIVVAGARKYGKTAICTNLMPIHSVIFPVLKYKPDGKAVDISKKFTVLLSASLPNSQRFLATICTTLENNDLIRQDFGEFYRNPDALVRERNKPWSARIAVTLNDKRFEAQSRKTKIRSTAIQFQRPDLIIGDDLEDDEKAFSVVQHERDYKWITEVVFNTLSDNGNMLVLGNLTNTDGLISRLITDAGDKKGWLHKIFRITETDPNTGDSVFVWPERFGPEYKQRLIEDIGEDAWEQEYQQNPDAASHDLKRSDVQYYDMDKSFLTETLPNLDVYVAIDPAASISRRSDLTAIVGVASDFERNIVYVLPAVLDKIHVSQHPKAVVDYAVRWSPLRFGIESVAYQSALVSQAREHAISEGVEINFEEIKQGRSNKEIRIMNRLFGRIREGSILFIRGDKTHKTIVEQVLNIMSPQYKKDGADALEMAVRLRDTDRMLRMGKKRGKLRARILKSASVA